MLRANRLSQRGRSSAVGHLSLSFPQTSAKHLLIAAFLVVMLYQLGCAADPTKPSNTGGPPNPLPVPPVTAPVEGPFRITGVDNPNCNNDPVLWTFCQHQTGGHRKGTHFGDDTYAWDMNLSGDRDAGLPVYAVADGKVVNYAGSPPGGTFGLVLVEHNSNGITWWSGYLHMTNISVQVNDIVSTSTVLGNIYHSGATNNHLHFVAYIGQNAPGQLRSGDVEFLQRNGACAYTLSSTSSSFNSAGGTGSVNVTAVAGCSWAATSNDNWISVTSGGSGTNNGTVNYSVALNPGTTQRSGTLTIAGLTFTITQSAGSCSYALSSTSHSFSSSSGTGTVGVTAGTGCAWTAISTDPWISVTLGNSGSGDGNVNYSILANSTSTQRSGTITIAGMTFTVTQSGTSCSYSLSSSSASFSSSSNTGSVSVSTGSGCPWIAGSNDSWITITSGSNGNGNGDVNYSVLANSGSGQRTGTLTVAGRTFTVTQSGMGATNRIANGSFSSGTANWTLSGDFWAGTNLSNSHTPPGYAAGGVDNTGSAKNPSSGSMYQTVAIPANASSVILSFWWNVTSNETTSFVFDHMFLRIRDSNGNFLTEITDLTNLNKGTVGNYTYVEFPNSAMLPFKGQTIRISFEATTDATFTTIFRIDDISLLSDGN